MLFKYTILLFAVILTQNFISPSYGGVAIEGDPVESPIFKDGFEEGLTGPLVSTVIIGPQGGDFNLSNGIKLSVPADAVPEETTFQFKVIQETETVLVGTSQRTVEWQYSGRRGNRRMKSNPAEQYRCPQ